MCDVKISEFGASGHDTLGRRHRSVEIRQLDRVIETEEF